MLRVAIIGCGRIADAHASQIQRVRGCEIVAACDREPLMARQLCERYQIKGHYADLAELLEHSAPDVVHITTPPASHFDLARTSLESGCHVYVEKPFTLHVEEAEQLVSIAIERRLKLTVGHDDQFSHAARRLRTLVNDGYLGGLPVHMESYFCYDIDNPTYARALLGDKDHWVRQLPGKLLQNIISHGIARIAEYLTTDAPHVMAHGYVSPVLKSIGETDIVDELRVVVSENERTSAYFTFSSQMRPSLHSFCIYGPKNGLILDQDHERIIMLPGARYKSYLDKFVPPLLLAKQEFGNFRANVARFLANDFHPKAGMKHLIERFYRSIADGGPEPIPTREILLTSWIMERIFEQLRTSALQRSTPVVATGHAVV